MPGVTHHRPFYLKKGSTEVLRVLFSNHTFQTCTLLHERHEKAVPNRLPCITCISESDCGPILLRFGVATWLASFVALSKIPCIDVAEDVDLSTIARYVASCAAWSFEPHRRLIQVVLKAWKSGYCYHRSPGTPSSSWHVLRVKSIWRLDLRGVSEFWMQVQCGGVPGYDGVVGRSRARSGPAHVRCRIHIRRFKVNAKALAKGGWLFRDTTLDSFAAGWLAPTAGSISMGSLRQCTKQNSLVLGRG